MITQKGATIDVLLTAPFVDIEQDVDGAVLRLDEMTCTVNISDFGLILLLMLQHFLLSERKVQAGFSKF